MFSGNEFALAEFSKLISDHRNSEDRTLHENQIPSVFPSYINLQSYYFPMVVHNYCMDSIYS